MSDVTGQTRAGNSLVTGNETVAPPDVVYVVRKGRQNESLRFSLRSLQNVPHGKVYISGGLPDFCQGVSHIYAEDDGNEVPEQQDSNLNLLYAAVNDSLSENFIFMNDDFFIMKPVDKIPIMHQGSLDERIAAYRSDNRFHQAYSLIQTKRELIRLGYGPELLSYELHMPMVMNKYKVQEMFRQFKLELFAMRPRTLYGNMYKLNGVFTQDAKESSDSEARYLSSGADFDASIAGERVRARFSKPGAYEPQPDPRGDRPTLGEGR